MPAKKRKNGARTGSRQKKAKAVEKKLLKKKSSTKKPLKRRASAPARKREQRELLHEAEIEGRDLFAPKHKDFYSWARRYSPVIITMLAGLITYFYLIFNIFYPEALQYGHYIQLLMIVLFVFLLIGVLMYLGLKSETLFIRMLSFIFVFVIFTFMLFFILISSGISSIR